jgi:circadian clock protein KaiC
MSNTTTPPADPLPRLPTGIEGLDVLTGGGLPLGESTLLCGATGTGKSLLGLQFLAAGISQFGEPAVFVTFDVSPAKIRRFAAGFGWDIEAWERSGDWAFVDASPSSEREVLVGEQFDLEPLVARITAAVRDTGAKRVVLDTITAVSARLGTALLVRGELRRVITALDDLGVTALIGAERDEGAIALTRLGVEEFVADNIIILRYVQADERRRRTIEVLKLRGGRHVSGAAPFAIMDLRGAVVIVLAEIPLAHTSSDRRVSIGKPGLDVMCGGGALHASVTLISGTTGAGKSLLAAEFLAAAGPHERMLLISFEESPDQITRNARGWGIDLDALRASGRLEVACLYAWSAPAERHLVQVADAIDAHRPDRLVIDGLTAVEGVTNATAFHRFVSGLTAYVKQRSITTLYTSTPHQFVTRSATDIGTSTLLDSIIMLRFVEIYGELHRAIAVLKLRGSNHDKTIRRLIIASDGSHIGAPFRTTTGILGGASLPLAGTELERPHPPGDEEGLGA